MGEESDPRAAAARYRAERAREAAGEQAEGETAPTSGVAWRSEPEPAPVTYTATQQAIRHGAFDDLPGAGKPIPGLGATHDPDWWIRRKIETEQLHGLGPAALTLRVENLELDQRLDSLSTEQDVRDVLEDFNARVVEARRQLLGGPPVVTPTRDVDAEVAAWQQRRSLHRAEERARRDAERTPARRGPLRRLFGR